MTDVIFSIYWDLQHVGQKMVDWKETHGYEVLMRYDFSPIANCYRSPLASGALGMTRAFSLSGVSCTIMTPWHRPRSAWPPYQSGGKMAQWGKKSAQVEHMWMLVVFFFCE